MKTLKLILGIIICFGIILSLFDFESYFGEMKTMADLYGYSIGILLAFLYGFWLAFSGSNSKKIYRKFYLIKTLSIIGTVILSISCVAGIGVSLEHKEITGNNIILAVFSTVLFVVLFAIAIYDIKSMIREIRNKGISDTAN